MPTLGKEDLKCEPRVKSFHPTQHRTLGHQLPPHTHTPPRHTRPQPQALPEVSGHHCFFPFPSPTWHLTLLSFFSLFTLHKPRPLLGGEGLPWGRNDLIRGSHCCYPLLSGTCLPLSDPLMIRSNDRPGGGEPCYNDSQGAGRCYRVVAQLLPSTLQPDQRWGLVVQRQERRGWAGHYLSEQNPHPTGGMKN